MTLKPSLYLLLRIIRGGLDGWVYSIQNSTKHDLKFFFIFIA